ncbi:MAG: hypothetical protein HFH69_10080 [Lachnospiraceae bacterium]|nr:hypothetical protein [Lachnospiraceae bacterium]
MSNLLTVPKDWKTFGYGECSFRVRLEYMDDKKAIMGFEADLPVSNITYI